MVRFIRVSADVVINLDHITSVVVSGSDVTFNHSVDAYGGSGSTTISCADSATAHNVMDAATQPFDPTT